MKYVLPFIITLIIIFSKIKRKNTYTAFINGASEGIGTLKAIFPSILAVVTVTSMLRVSGAMDMLTAFLSPLSNSLGISDSVMMLAVLRPLSGGGSLGLLSDILKSDGADTFIGKTASVIMGATETTFYCISVYFAKTRIKSSFSILAIALFCDFISVVLAVWAVKFF